MKKKYHARGRSVKKYIREGMFIIKAITWKTREKITRRKMFKFEDEIKMISTITLRLNLLFILPESI